MNEVYVIQSEGFKTALELTSLLNRFGVYAGRYLAQQPHDVLNLIKSNFHDVRDLELKKINRLLQLATERRAFINKKGISWCPNSNWHENSLNNIQIKAVDGAITFDDSSAKHDFHTVYDVAEWGAADERIEGIASEYVRVSETLLMINEELYFIDPYLNPLTKRYSEVLHQYLGVIAKNRRCRNIYLIARHNVVVRDYDDENLILGDIRTKLNSLKRLANVKDLTIHFWLADDKYESNRLHGRYLLTRRGGLQLDQGFQTLGKGTFVDAIPLSASRLDDLWSTYITNQSFKNCMSTQLKA